jgi:deoxyribodipyrimidine photo-lyase
LRALVWFRSDLRLRDNTALHEAGHSADELVAAFLVSPRQWRAHDWGAVKVDFVLRNARALGESLAGRGIPLRVVLAPTFDDAPRAIAELLREERCSALFYNREHEVNELARDRAVERELAPLGVPVRAFDDQTVIPPERLRTRAGDFYKVFTPFARAWRDELHRGGLPRPLPAPRSRGSARRDVDPWPDAGFGPAPPQAASWPAGEREALARLDRFVAQRLVRYEADRDFPARDGTSRLSPYLACGVLSPRQCLAAVADAHEGSVDVAGPGGAAWLDELVWREFYRHVLVGFPRVCRGRAFRPETERLPWNDDDDAFERWRAGLTGVPIVDAGMRQLARTGCMHNRLRMIVAMYLTKDLFIDWRRGERWFMESLVDGDFANNNGGWQWCASTGTDAAPYFRVFNPVAQSRRFDPRGELIRAMCPELASLDERSIHDPPMESRARLGYPEPLVDHAAARRRTLASWRGLAGATIPGGGVPR